MRSWRSWIGSLRTVPRRSSNGSAGIKAREPDRRRALRPQLFFYLTLALLPIAAVSVVQGIERARIDTANVHARLLQAAHDAATDENETLASAERLIEIVSGFDEVKRMTSGCDEALAAAFGTSRLVANLVRTDASGVIVCSALPLDHAPSLASLPVFRSAETAENFVFSGEFVSPLLRRPVVAMMLPLKDAQGRFAGVIAADFDLRSLNRLLVVHALPSDGVIALFDRSNHVLAATSRLLGAQVFAHASPDRGAQDRLQQGSDARGKSWTYVTTPLIGDSVFVGYAMPESTLFGTSRLNVGTDFALPILMIILAWWAISYATYRLVTKWIHYLRRVAAAYRSGHYAVRPALDEAPSEFQLLGEALADMAAAIQDRDRRLHEAVDQKSTLVREVHHRVKNNLQIVMSLLSLQAGQLRDDGARDALTQAQVRINALALVHRILHEIEDQSTVDLQRLLEELAQQVAGGLGTDSSGFEVETDILAKKVTGDQAVPIALFTVEALTNIFKHAYPAGTKAGHIRVTLGDIGAGRLRLAIEDDGIGFDSEAEPGSKRSLGSRLIHTFGVQVGGSSSIRSAKGKGTVVELIFPDPNQRQEQPERASAA